jgi:ubiquitin carboxyl-terminal hydrolase 2/21
MHSVTKVPAYEEIADKPHESVSAQSHRWWNNYQKRNSSVITDIFSGQLWSQITCKKCRTQSNTFDPFFDLSLPIPILQHQSPPSRPSSATLRRGQYPSSEKDKETVQLMDCLRAFLTSETLAGSDAYRCAACKTFRECEKKLTLYRFPKTLVVHLKRFTHRHNVSSKINTNVSFPLNLDLSELCSYEAKNDPVNSQPDHEGFKYRLVAICLHSGTVDGGKQA